MIIRGRVALQRKTITNLRSGKHQTQPWGIDLTLRKVMNWSTAEIIDFDNEHRKTAATTNIPFESCCTSTSTQFDTGNSSDEGVQQGHSDPALKSHDNYLDLRCGSYLVEFNEMVNMPLDLMGYILVRSSLFRSGAVINAGVMDSGYKGAIGAMLQVVNPHGVRLLRNAKLAQMVFHEMSEPVKGYSSVYQVRMSV